MSGRMSKYDSDTSVKRRTQKNENLYSEVGNMNIDFVDIDVDNAVELNPSSTGRASREDFQKQRELNKILPNNREKIIEEPEYIEPKEDRVYDINEILKMARQNKLFEDREKKRLINTEYNILTKLDVSSLENEAMKKEDLRSLIDEVYEKEAPKKERKVYSRTAEEKLLNDLFDDDEKFADDEDFNLEEELSKNVFGNSAEEKEEINKEEKDDMDEDKDEEDTIATQITEDNPVPQEMYDFGIEKPKKGSKNKPQNLLEGVDLEKERRLSKQREREENKQMKEEFSGEFDEESEGKGLVIAIIIVVILILFTCAFFVYEYFFGV